VRSVAREVRDLDKDVAHHLAPFEHNNGGGGSTSSSFNPSEHPAIACALLVDHLCMRRNKRCLLAYHRVRAEKLEEMCWKGIDVLEQQQPTTNAAAGITAAGNGEAVSGAGTAAVGVDDNNTTTASSQNSLSPEEEEYFRLYSEMLAGYKGQWTDIDLTGSLEPPKDLFIDVRVLKDAGEIQTEYGAINLTKNSQFYVRQGDVERLIAQGYLQRLS